MKDNLEIMEYSDGCKFISGLPTYDEKNKQLAYANDIRKGKEILYFLNKRLENETDPNKIAEIRSIIQIETDIINQRKLKLC